MAKILHYRDVGFDCATAIQAETEGEVLAQTAEHAKATHGMDELSPDTVEQIRTLIKTSRWRGNAQGKTRDRWARYTAPSFRGQSHKTKAQRSHTLHKAGQD